MICIRGRGGFSYFMRNTLLGSGVILKENISEFFASARRSSCPRGSCAAAAVSRTQNAQQSSVRRSAANGDLRRERPPEGPVAVTAPLGVVGRADGPTAEDAPSKGGGILPVIHCAGGTATMNKGAAAALEEEEDWRRARCDCTTVRRVRRRPATARASASAAAAAATTFLG